MVCPNCGKQISPNDSFCTGCGCKFENSAAVCTRCGVALKPEQNFCFKCGMPESNALSCPPQPKYCSRCGKMTSADDSFCTGCGFVLKKCADVCTQCGEALKPADQFCIRCGKAVSVLPAVPPPISAHAAPPLFRPKSKINKKRIAIISTSSLLAALPPVAGDSFTPMAVLSALPKAGASRTTLTTLGFQFKEYGSWGCYDEKNRVSIDIYKDAWSDQTDEWNRNVIWYYQVVNGHQLAIAYYPDKLRCEAQIYEKEDPVEGGAEAYFVYDSQNKAVLDSSTMGTEMTPEEFFSVMLGIPQTGTIYTDVMGMFDKYSMDQFNMAPEELYRLDAE